jgi:hypothetical protein
MVTGRRVWEPTTDQILNLDGVKIREDRFRFELCDRDWRPIGDLHPDRGSTPTISVNTEQVVSRQLSGLRLMPDEAADINGLTDRLRVYMVLQNGASFLLGSFMWASASRPHRSWGIEHHGELGDLGIILDQESTRAYGWNRGTNAVLMMFFLLFRANIKQEWIETLGQDGRRSIAEPMSWEPGATWATMLTDIGNLFGFASPVWTREGKVRFDVAPSSTRSPATVPAYEADTRILADSIAEHDDLLGAPNDFAAFDSGNDRLRVGRYQLPSTAPHSFARRGFRLGMTESVQGLESQAQANRAVRNMVRRSSRTYEWLAFDSTLDPRHDVFDVVPALGRTWIETAHAMELRSGGRHSHTLRRTAFVESP